MDYTRLKNNIIDSIKEEQVKLGYRKETIRFYYPLSSLNRYLNSDLDAKGMQAELEHFAAGLTGDLGETGISHTGDRFCIRLSETATEWVHDHTPQSGFIYDFVDIISKHGITLDDILSCFKKYSESVAVKNLSNGEFNYLIYFENGIPDDYRYCLTEETDHFIYHRFTVEDYRDYDF